jgi:hypothetical protein
VSDTVKTILAALLFAAFGCYTTWRDGPRIVTDLFQSAAYGPAERHEITDYKCTNWNGFMWNDCTIHYVEVATGHKGEISDHRFGRAPKVFPALLEHRADPSQLTTDVSLSTVVNRSLFTLFFLFMTGVCLLVVWQQIAGTSEPEALAPKGPSGSANGAVKPAGAANSPRTFGRRPQA